VQENDGLSQLASAINSLAGLSSLDISIQCDDHSEGSYLKDFVKVASLKGLEKLSLGCGVITNQVINEMTKALKMLSGLRYLSLMGNGSKVDEEQLKPLFSSIRGLPSLETLAYFLTGDEMQIMEGYNVDSSKGEELMKYISRIC